MTEVNIKTKKLPRVLSQTTIRDPPFCYLQLTLLSSSTISVEHSETADVDIDESAKPASPPAVDLLTARTHLTSALRQFLGITGTAIPVDILKCEERDVWVRVPHEDAMVVIEALSGWVGDDVAWRVKQSGTWLVGLAMANGVDLFAE